MLGPSRLSVSSAFMGMLVGFVFLLTQTEVSYADASDCAAALSSDLKLTISGLNFEESYYHVDLEYSSSTDGLIWFKLTNAALDI